MGFLDQRKKDTPNMKTLTEKEIQEKLYGRFRNSARATAQDYYSSAPKESHAQAASVLDSFTAEKETPVITKEAVKAPEFSTRKTGSSETVTPKKDFNSETLSTPRPAEWGTRQISRNESFSSGAQSQPFKEKKSFNSSGVAGFKPKKPFLIQPVLRKTGEILLSALQAFLAIAAQISKMFDFRDSRKRRLITWVSSILFVGSLLWGIHLLNVSREKAMKEPRQRATPAVTASTSSENAVVRDEESPLSRSTRETVSSAAGADEEAGLPTDAQGLFVIQVATYVGPNDAQALVDKMKEDQIPAFVRSSTRTGGKTYFTVLIGRFKTYRDAQDSLVRFQKKELAKNFQDAFIRTLSA